MWILRLHLLQSKDYNKINRICKKYGFSARNHSSVLYAKASVKYATQKSSWRTLSREFHIDHAALSKFFKNAQKSGLLEEIFHVFLESRSCLYIGENRTFTCADLGNSQEIYTLTKREFESMI